MTSRQPGKPLISGRKECSNPTSERCHGATIGKYRCVEGFVVWEGLGLVDGFRHWDGSSAGTAPRSETLCRWKACQFYTRLHERCPYEYASVLQGYEYACELIGYEYVCELCGYQYVCEL